MTQSQQDQNQRFSGLSIAGFICSWFVAPIGIILSALAISEINRNEDTLRGKGMAKWGIGLGVFSMIAWALFGWALYEDAAIKARNDEADRKVQQFYQNNPGMKNPYQ